MALQVNEIFYSIQGESTYAGRPCVFVRLTGCNLRCAFCDTPYAYEQGEWMGLDEILHRVFLYGCRLVEITGGEPLFQKETPALIRRLLDEGFEVLLETNGSMDISRVDDRCAKIVDIKCPSSGMRDRNDLENLNRLKDKDELKFVVGNREDYDYAKEVISMLGQHSQHRIPVHLSPVFNAMDPETLAAWILEDHLDVRLHLQMHKIIWGADRREV